MSGLARAVALSLTLLTTRFTTNAHDSRPHGTPTAARTQNCCTWLVLPLCGNMVEGRAGKGIAPTQK